MKRQDLKVALVHDFLTGWGGAEKVLEVLAEMFPKAPIYTLLYDKEKMRGKFEGREIHTSFLQKFPKFLRRRPGWLLPFLPTAPETFDLREFDLVISSSGAWSKGIVTKLNTVHIAYIHSPMRFVWDYNERYLKENRKNPGLLVRALLNYLRVWDRQAADRPDYLIANSKYTQKRIEKYYRRESTVIYPPICGNFQFPISNFQANSNDQKTKKLKAKKYFLVVSRLSPYKRVDLVVDAFNKLELPLLIVGEGRDRNRLEKMAKGNVKILGWKSDEDLASYYRNARAVIFPTLDDFGIVPVEAMSFGVPVIAYKKGGALETVEEGVSGEFFETQSPEVLADALRRFMEKEDKYDRELVRKKAEEFGRERFKNQLEEFIEKRI